VTPVYGGAIADFERFAQDAAAACGTRIGAGALCALLHNHGTAYGEVLGWVDQDPALAATIGRSNVIKAEVVHAVRQELAQHLGDVIWRRTNLGAGGDPDELALRTCADLMAVELGWDAAKAESEVQHVQAALTGAAL
jgi:glycerol-3-phosphate dehydrogenase